MKRSTRPAGRSAEADAAEPVETTPVAPTAPEADGDSAPATRPPRRPDRPRPYPSAVPDRLPPPGPSFLREHEVRIGDRTSRAGMARPSDAPDGWWLTLLWVTDDDGVVSFRDVAPSAGPPPDPPLARLGPALAGALSGFILEDDGRLQVRVAGLVPPDDPSPPVAARPLVVRAAFRFEPARVAAMRPNELAETVLAAFRRASRAWTTLTGRRASGSGRPARLRLTDARPVRRFPRGAPPPGGRRARRGPRRQRPPVRPARRADGDPDPDDRDDDDRDDDGEPPREPVPPRRTRVDRRSARGGRRRRVTWWITGSSSCSSSSLFSVGLDLWTDALWYQSVGFDGVFWTRLGAQVGLFAGDVPRPRRPASATCGWPAGSCRPRSRTAGGSFRTLFERLNEAAQPADPDRGPGDRRDQTNRARSPSTRGDIPDLTPVARVVLVGARGPHRADHRRLGRGVLGDGPAVGQSRAVLPGSAAAVTDPVFGRDIGYFLFELPFLRFVQALFNGIVVAALVLVLRALPRRGHARQPRVHDAGPGPPRRARRAVPAVGRVRLPARQVRARVQHARRLFTGVSFTDQNAQFFAYDVLTVLSGLAGALLVGGAFTRMLWPLGLVVGVWLLASIVVGRLYPEAIQRFTVQPNQYAQEAAYIANNIAMTRLAFGLDDWEEIARSGARTC